MQGELTHDYIVQCQVRLRAKTSYRIKLVAHTSLKSEPLDHVGYFEFNIATGRVQNPGAQTTIYCGLVEHGQQSRVLSRL